MGVVLSDNMIVLYGFWELTSITSFLLIAFHYKRKASTSGAQKSFLITVFGGFAMLTGFMMMYLITGTFSIRATITGLGQFQESALFLPALILILIGAFTKSAQFPFHIWLPDAMEAPTPVSAYLHSATMVKAGLYVVARFTPIFGGQGLWFWLVTGVGLLTFVLWIIPGGEKKRSQSDSCLFDHLSTWSDHVPLRGWICCSLLRIWRILCDVHCGNNRCAASPV